MSSSGTTRQIGGWRFSLHTFSPLSTTSSMTMGTAPVPPLPMWRRDRTNAAVDSDAEDESRDKPNGYVFLCPFVLPTLLFFLLFFFPVLSFAAEYHDVTGGTGSEQHGRQQKHGAGRESNGCVFCCYYFLSLSTLSCSSSYLTLLFFCRDLFLRDVQNIVKQQARSHETGRDQRN